MWVNLGLKLILAFTLVFSELEAKLIVEMTSTRRTNLFRIKPVTDIGVPILSIGLMDLSQSTLSSFAQIESNTRVVGGGTFAPSFGVGISIFFIDCLTE